MTTITTESIIEKPFELTKSIVFDLHSYPNWWFDFKAEFDISDSAVYFSPIRFVRFKIKLENKTEDSIQFQYKNTPFYGFGTWTIKKINADNTLVSYSISLKGKNLISDTFVSSRFFKRKHEKDILNLIKKLEQL